MGTVIADWLERKRQQAIDADSHAMDTLRRRAAVIGFRAGMLCYLLELLPHEFTTGDLIKLRARKGQSVHAESIRKLLQRWRKNGRIEKTAENSWSILRTE